MDRRRYLGVVSGVIAGLSGCTTRAFSVPDLSGREAAPRDCPSVLAVDETVCSDEDGPITVEQSRETVSGDGWSMQVVVENGSETPIGINPDAWSLFRRVEAAWNQVAPDVPVTSGIELPPGQRYRWQLTDTRDRSDAADQLVVVDLAPGTYAFAVPLRAERSMGAVITFAVSR